MIVVKSAREGRVAAVTMSNVSALHQFFRTSDLPGREALIDAMISTILAVHDDDRYADAWVTRQLANALEFCNMGTRTMGTYSLADQLMSLRERITNLSTGGDPLWYIDDMVYHGSTDQLRDQLIAEAEAEWAFLLSSITVA